MDSDGRDSGFRGRPGYSDGMTQDLSELRAQLTERLAAAKAESETTEEDRKPVALDPASIGRLSRMDAMQVQAMAQAVEERRKGEALRLIGAIARIDAGEYGTCLKCGDEIAPKRLAADPTAPTCIGCAG